MNLLAQLLAVAMARDNPTLAFRSAIKRRLDEGEKRETLIADLEGLRKSVDPSQEEVILEIPDFLHGWCSPEMKL